MSEFKERLIQEYRSHYEEMNPSIDPTSPNRKSVLCWQRTWGPMLARLPADLPILDLACGTGFLSFWLAKTQRRPVIAVDASVEMIRFGKKQVEEAGERVCLTFEVSDGLKYLQNTELNFAAIFCTDILEHLSESELAEWLLAVQKRLGSNSKFCCRVPNASNLLASYSRYIDLTHTRCFSASSLRQLLRAYDFSSIQVFDEVPGHLLGKVRQQFEHFLHRFLFRLTGRTGGEPFGRNIYAIANGSARAVGS
jgi:SAM-dependent methyltransferase